MKLGATPGVELTYCTNVHAAESWEEVREVLERAVPAVKRALGVPPETPFGVGLRLSDRAARALESTEEREELGDVLTRHGLYVFTLNGFPYGSFGGSARQPIKAEVYRPDWLEPERSAYTDRLINLLMHLLPEGGRGTISTLPGAFEQRAVDGGERDEIARRLIERVAALSRLRDETGRCVTLALEPEPGCLLEDVAGAIAFFEGHLLSRAAVERLVSLTGVTAAQAESDIRLHLGVCVDACHLSVAFESPGDALRALDQAGVSAPKVQLSAGLSARFEDPQGPELAALEAFAEPIYLHQVVERAVGEDAPGVRFLDLPDAIRWARGNPARPREWRVHFHVPVFTRDLGAFETTQADLVELICALAQRKSAVHLEVETYTWEVLPPALRAPDLAAAIAKEVAWARDRWSA